LTGFKFNPVDPAILSKHKLPDELQSTRVSLSEILASFGKVKSLQKEIKKTNKNAEPHRHRKEYFFRAALFLIPLIVLLGVEIALRLFNYGANLDLFITLEKNAAYWITNPQIGRRYFLNKNFLPATSYDAFRKQKPTNAYRIFVLGESAAAGFPYFNNGSFSRLLRTRLQARHPNKIIEMVNLGLPAVSSYTLLDLADELVNYQPDAVLIYAGHNEFYGALGSASTESFGQARWVIKLYLRLQHLKLVQLLRQTIFALRTQTPSAMDGDRTTLMARMAGQKQIPYRSELYNKTLQTFRDNLAEIIQILQGRGVKIMLSELVSNVGDQRPFVSIFDDKTNRRKWQAHFDRGAALAQAGSYDAALSAFQQAAQLNEAPAILHFEIAKCLMKLNRSAEAQTEFLKAKDFDALRFRASENLNQVVRDLSAKFNVPVVPMAKMFADASPHGIVGNNLLLEHVHANVQGYFLMAKAFDENMKRHHFVPTERDEQLLPADSVFWQQRGVTELDEELARLRIQVLVSNWPFQPEAQKFTPLTYNPGNVMEQLAYALWREEISWDAAHLQLAEHYAKTKQPEKAAAEYEALVIGMPYLVAPYLRLGLTYMTLNRFDGAFDIFMKSLAVEPTALAQKWLGSISIHQNQIPQGLDYLRQALQKEPNDPETLYNISVGYAKSGDFANAKDFAEKLVRGFPNYPGAKEHWQRLQAYK
jgi:tetratricopeptide (TPR) repeat protein